MDSVSEGDAKNASQGQVRYNLYSSVDALYVEYEYVPVCSRREHQMTVQTYQ